MSKKLSATKKYASPVLKRCFRQKYPSKLFRRIYRADAQRQAKAKMRSRKHHVVLNPETKRYENGPKLHELVFARTVGTRATGSLKRSERHPPLRQDGVGKRPWGYVCR